MKVSHHIILLSVVCFIGLMQSTNIYAQETTTREERIKQLQLLQSKYDQEESCSDQTITQDYCAYEN